MSNVSKPCRSPLSTKMSDLNPYEINEIRQVDRPCRKVEEILEADPVMAMSTRLGDMASTFRQMEGEVRKPP